MEERCGLTGDSPDVCSCHRHRKGGGLNHKENITLDVIGSEACKASTMAYNTDYFTKTTDKLDYSKIPMVALEELALAYTIGAKKHKYHPQDDPTTDDQEFSAIMRHLVAYRNGEERDPEGHHHLAAVSARCFKLMARRRK